MENTELIKIAKKAMENAYVPYSHFRVGAALVTENDEIYTGCNIENASYGGTNCAERTALFSAIAAGCRPGDLTHLAVIGDTDEPISPCGACRQVIVELGGAKLTVIQANLRGTVVQTTAAKLLPDSFSLRPDPVRNPV